MNYSITPNYTRNYNQSFGTLNYKKGSEILVKHLIERGMPDVRNTSKRAIKKRNELDGILEALRKHKIPCELSTCEDGIRLQAIVDKCYANPVIQKNTLFQNSIVKFFNDVLKEADKRKTLRDSVHQKVRKILYS